MHARHDRSALRDRTSAVRARLPAFSLVEILVVIAIIGILLAIVFKGGSALVRNAKTRETQALVNKLQLAIDAYKLEVDTSRIPNAKNIFNGSPPDDLRAFWVDPSGGSVLVGGCPLRMRNAGSFPGFSDPDNLIDQRDNSGRLANPENLLHADIRAMVLAMRLYSPKAKAILDSIDPQYWAEPDDAFVFLPAPNATPIRLDYLVDAWGVPLEYYSTCLCVPRNTSGLTPREIVSNDFVHENNDGGVVVSYGADGSEQFASDMFSAEGDTTVVADYYEEIAQGNKGVINNSFNSDNVYSSDFFANRVRQAP